MKDRVVDPVGGFGRPLQQWHRRLAERGRGFREVRERLGVMERILDVGAARRQASSSAPRAQIEPSPSAARAAGVNGTIHSSHSAAFTAHLKANHSLPAANVLPWGWAERSCSDSQGLEAT